MQQLKKLPLWLYGLVGILVASTAAYIVIVQRADQGAREYQAQAKTYITGVTSAKTLPEVHQAVGTKPSLKTTVFGSVISSAYRDAEAMQAYIAAFAPMIEDASAEAAVTKPIYDWYNAHYIKWMTSYYEIRSKYINTGVPTASGDGVYKQFLESSRQELRELREAFGAYLNDLAQFHLPTDFYDGVVEDHKKAAEAYKVTLDEAIATINPTTDKDTSVRNRMMLKVAYAQRHLFESMDVINQIEKPREKVVLASLPHILESSQSLGGIDTARAKVRSAGAVYVSWAENSMPTDGGLTMSSAGRLVSHWLDKFVAVVRSTGASDASQIIDRATAAQTSSLLLETLPESFSNPYEPLFFMSLQRVILGGIERITLDPIELNTQRVKLMQEVPRPEYLQGELSEMESIFNELLSLAKSSSAKDIPINEKSAIATKQLELGAKLQPLMGKIAVKLDDTKTIQSVLLSQLAELRK